MGKAGHLGVLLGHTVPPVDQDEAHVAALNGHGGPEDAVFFNVLFHLGLLAHSCGVDKQKFPLFILKGRVDGIPGGACHIADDAPLLP
ncbi:hypothetical protein SDC9_98977 [bioreactor metagenome]|uniref:Uncharacterized protein n=1 Tax=bioreactor metagenome TaxID=1076179 RepID=A0A645AGA1_9ZZZZ